MFNAVLKTMRPKQWAKNGFLFAGLIFDRQLNNPSALLTTAVGFVIFCLLSSSTYFLNDLSDIEEDRQHPRKRYRPIPAGDLAPTTAISLVGIFLLISIPASFLLDPVFFILGISYLVINLTYTKWLKHVPLLDVLLLAIFYLIRVGAGVALIQVQRFSPWLYVFTTFLALYLGIGKRRAELSSMTESANNTRRVLEGYTIPFLDQLTIIVSSMTIITYSLYTFSAPNLPENHIMMFTIPFVIYGIFRYLYLTQVRNIGEAPEEVLFSDRPLQIAIALWGLSVLIIFYFPVNFR